MLVLAGVALLAVGELPALYRRRCFGEFWAATVLLLFGLALGLVVAWDLPLPSLLGWVIRAVEPFGRMMVGGNP